MTTFLKCQACLVTHRDFSPGCTLWCPEFCTRGVHWTEILDPSTKTLRDIFAFRHPMRAEAIIWTRAYPPTMKCAQTDRACARGMHYAWPSEGVEPTPHSGPPGCGRAHPAPARRPTPSDGSVASDPLVVVELTPEAMQGWNVRAVGRTRT